LLTLYKNPYLQINCGGNRPEGLIRKVVVAAAAAAAAAAAVLVVVVAL
jgi:hypothetical protein